MARLTLALLVLLPAAAMAQLLPVCPFSKAFENLPGWGQDQYPTFNETQAKAQPYNGAIKPDIKALFKTYSTLWPFDASNTYAPLFLRLAWSCAGTYRNSDGRGGCNGARIRFEPEHSHVDNTNLDKALKMLFKIKDMWGNALSWGDLIVLAGNSALEAMGAPTIGYCLGRIDDYTNEESLYLGPTPEQQRVTPCTVPGDCKAPLGTAEIGRIAVNPEGPNGNGDPVASAKQIRDVFARKNFNDRETVALVGGGHAFGRAHGACPGGAGPTPIQDPNNPWPGTCNVTAASPPGKGANTYTLGFEGPWTTTPTKWSNQYFQNLINYDWSIIVGPGGKKQWTPKTRDGTVAPKIMMLTSDIAFIKDPAYLALVTEFANNQAALDVAFANAWYKLTTQDMGPYKRCFGGSLPPAQPFQMPLPAPPAKNLWPDVTAVKKDIRAQFLTTDPAITSIISPDLVGPTKYWGAQLVWLAFQCIGSFHQSNFMGGCNGARIRLPPMVNWPENNGADRLLKILEPIKNKYGAGLTWADLIVLAGNVGIEDGSGGKVPFCFGRSDAVDGAGVTDSMRWRRDYPDPITQFRDLARLRGLTIRQAVALMAMQRSPLVQIRMGYSGSWTWRSDWVNYAYYKVLMNDTWIPQTTAAGKLEYRSGLSTPTRYMMPIDLAIRWDPEMLAISQEYARDHNQHLLDLITAWVKLQNADLFNGPGTPYCPAYTAVAPPACPNATAPGTTVG